MATDTQEAPNGAANAVRIAELLEDPEQMTMLRELLAAVAGGGRRSFLSGTPFTGGNLTFDLWSQPSSIMASAGLPGIQPVQGGGAVQFLGGSPVPVDSTMRTAALLSLGTNLLEAYRSVQRSRQGRGRSTGGGGSRPRRQELSLNPTFAGSRTTNDG